MTVLKLISFLGIELNKGLEHGHSIPYFECSWHHSPISFFTGHQFKLIA